MFRDRSLTTCRLLCSSNMSNTLFISTLEVEGSKQWASLESDRTSLHAMSKADRTLLMSVQCPRSKCRVALNGVRCLSPRRQLSRYCISPTTYYFANSSICGSHPPPSSSLFFMYASGSSTGMRTTYMPSLFLRNLAALLTFARPSSNG